MSERQILKTIKHYARGANSAESRLYGVDRGIRRLSD